MEIPRFRPYFETLINALECNENDQMCFYALSVLITMTTNPCKELLSFYEFLNIDYISLFLGVDSVILESVCLTVKSSVN